MAQTYRTDERIPAPAVDVLALLIDAESQEALLRHLGTPDVRCDVEERGDDRLRVSVTTNEPALMGAGNHHATLEMDWNLSECTCAWVRHDHTFGERVQAHGTTRVEPAGDEACRVIEEGTVDVSIPVVGRRVAKTVVKKITDQAPKKAVFWTKRLREAT